MRRIGTSIGAQQSLLREIRPVVAAEQSHELRPMRCEVTGRTIPLWPGLCGILIELLATSGWRPNAVTAENEDKLQPFRRDLCALRIKWQNSADSRDNQREATKSAALKKMVFHEATWWSR